MVGKTVGSFSTPAHPLKKTAETKRLPVKTNRENKVMAIINALKLNQYFCLMPT
jgi:hypothetical protein